MSVLNEVTPIFAVYLNTIDGLKKHFANFYGTTIDTEGLNDSEVVDKVQNDDAEIFSMINELEQKIKTGNFEKVKSDLLVDVNWAQFGGFMHEKMGKMEDALFCGSVERAFDLFKRAYKDVGKTSEQIMKEKLDDFEKNLEKVDQFF